MGLEGRAKESWEPSSEGVFRMNLPASAFLLSIFGVGRQGAAGNPSWCCLLLMQELGLGCGVWWLGCQNDSGLVVLRLAERLETGLGNFHAISPSNAVLH